MIRDVLVIKDGLPLFSKNYCNTPNFISNQNNLIMVSGFLSALNSFSEEFEDLGSIKELKLSNSDLRLAFLKNSTIPNLIFLASFDDKTKSVDVQRFLRKMSFTFLKKYNIEQILSWNGKINEFESFSEIVYRYIEEEKNEFDDDFQKKVLGLFEEIQTQIDFKEKTKQETVSENISTKSNKSTRDRLDLVPKIVIKKKINPQYYITGRKSLEVFKKINNRSTIREIASSLNLDTNNVYNICKNLIKIGFIKLF